MCSERVFAPSRRTKATCGINSSARAARCGRVCVVEFGAIGRGSRVSAAGITWTSRARKARWAARFGHTSVIDAAGAIYVIGGYNGSVFQDVWASTDGGARRDLVKRRVVGGYYRGYSRGYSQGYSGY